MPSKKRSIAVLHRACFEPLETRRLLAASLVAAYSMDENAGTTVADASSSGGNNGVASNTTWATGKFGSGLKFTGAVGSMVTIPDAASLHLTQMTLEAWVDPTSLTSPEAGWDAVVAKDHVKSSNDIAYALYGAQGTNTGPSGHALIGSTDRGTGSTALLTLNKWTFLSVTYDGTTLRTYVNGAQVTSKAVSGSIASTGDPLHIGGDWSGEMFTGVIDNVRVYNGALTAAQIQADMNAPVAPLTPAVTGTTPAAGATGVARNLPITATFNESIQSSTLTFTLADSSGNPIVGTVSYSDATHTATFTPAAPLAASTTYTATVSGAKDAAGNSMAAPLVWTFTTAAVVLPVVTTESPTLNASNVPLNTTVTATFNESIQPATLAFTVVDSGNNPVPGAVTYSDTTHTAMFTPNTSLNPESNYTVSVGGAQDVYGEAMAAPLVWSFSTSASQQSPLQVIAQSPAANATNVSVQATVTVTFNESIQPATLTFVLRDDKTNPISGSVAYNDATHTATFTPAAPLVAGMTYNAIASDAQDQAGNVMDHDSWVFTTQALGTGPFSIWSPSATPASPNDDDASQTEVGVKFRTDVAGFITGIRFYKGAQNTGVHVGHLWTSTGQLLASATFTGETASGWQQVTFSTPVQVQPNTTYVASYHTTSGHYAEDDNFFASKGVDSGPLHALAAGVDGSDGVYVNSTQTATFPTQNFKSANYWVDVVFNTSVPVGPTVISQSPAPGATNVATSVPVTVTFNESVQPATISFVLKDASNATVAGSVAYDDGTHTATFTPAAALSPSATYTATVSNAVDAGGTAMANPAMWSFTTASPANDPSIVGQWGSVQNWPLVALNQILLKNGKILMYDGGPACIGSSSATVYDPATGTFTPVPVDNSKDNNDIFCSGAVTLADGRVVVVGGHDCTGSKTGIASLNIFNPDTMTWQRGPNMAFSRWYPTATLLSDGRVLVTAGADQTDTTLVTTPEIYDPVSNTWTQLTAAKQTINNYPFMFVLPDGRVLEAGSDEAPLPTKVLDLSTNTWTVVDPNVVDGSSAVMYRPGMVLKAGASCPEEGEVLNKASSPNAYVLDMTQGSPHWVQTQSMANARTWLDLTMLPDGNVLASGGSRQIGGVDPSTAVLPAEEWNPDTGTWTTLASMATPRMYHSTAVLLPDGRVLVAGGGHNYVNNADYFSAEYYSPAYLFKGPRPTISSAPSQLAYGNGFSVQTPDASNIASVSLIRCGAVTHAFDEDQRYVPLTFTANGSGSLTVQAPADPNLAPPGYYMLFIVNKQGVPSVAPIVNLPSGFHDTTAPTAPASPAATGGYGSVSLSWGASTDNVGVTAYTIFRSTTSGFTPSAANQVATTTSLSFVDTGLAPGTYYYVVTASDAAGNVSTPSIEAPATVLSDSIAPSVAIAAPAAGATVAGVVALSASASDNVGVTGVQFLVDGVKVGSVLTSAPFTFNWASTSVANGTHTITATASDAAGNTTTSASVAITVNNTSPGLVAAYNFDEGSGTTLIDRSGNGNNGSIANATWVAGEYGGGLQFNGTTSLVTVADSAGLNLTTGMTLEAWIDPSSLKSPDANWAAVIAKGHLDSANDIAYGLYDSQGTGTPPGGHVLIGSTDYGAGGGSTLTLNQWVFLSATYDGTTLRTYLNGTLIGSRAIKGTIFSTTDPLTLGGDWSSEMFTGIIDNVRIYNTALTAAQLQQDMSTPI